MIMRMNVNAFVRLYNYTNVKLPFSSLVCKSLTQLGYDKRATRLC